MKWTSQQEAAINARGSDLLVAAAAGSGKTAVLVERIVSLVREGTPIDSMLIVTFTNAAAAEMRQRITEAFEHAAAGGDAFAAAQSMRIEHASISTLHRFCITVLRTHFQSAGIDPSFRTGDDAQTHVLREAAMQDAIDACFESEDPDFQALCECFRDDQLPELAFSVYAFMMSRPDPWSWLDEAITACDTEADALARSPWIETLLEDARLTLVGTGDLIASMQSLASHPSGPVGYESTVENDAQLLDSLAQSLGGGYASFTQALTEVKFSTLPRKSGAEDPDLADRFKKVREELKKSVKTLSERFSQPLEQAAEDIASMTDVLRGLEKLLKTFQALYTALKTQRNLLDYNDLEHLTLRALEDDAVADSLREKYALIFVDEYQDSNAIQETILNRIARPGSLFFVGDVKQSIYGFRQAEPSLFLSKYARYSQEAGAPERKIDLNQNFRSRKNVLECTNVVFSRCMRARVTDIEYDAQARLYPGLSHPDPDPPTEVLLLSTDAEELPDGEAEDGSASGEAEETEDLTRIEQEALVCARKIREMVGKRTIYDAKSDTFRLVRYRDIAVLLRSMRLSGPVIVQILAAQGIPAICDAGEGYFDMPEVRQMLSILQVIDNGLSDEALLSSLRGEMARMDEESLAAVRIAYPEEAFASACVRYAQEKDDTIALCLRAFYQRIEDYRLDARYQSLETLVSRVMHESGVYARAGALPGGAARQANLRLLCQRARDYQGTQNGSLGGFLAYAQRLRAGGDSQSARLMSENEDVVRIMTMHKSKGLEFPIVFLLALGQRFNLRALTSPLLLHAQLGLGMLCYDASLRAIRSTLSHEAIKLRLRHDALCEEIRVLYVAMTRARDQLFLIGTLSKSQGLDKLCRPLTDSALAGARTFLQLILPALLDHPVPRSFHTPLSLDIDHSHWHVTLLPAPRTQKTENPGDLPLSALLESLENAPVPRNEVSRRLSLRVPEHVRAQLKTSVTQLLREGEADPALETLEPIHRLPQFMEQSALSGATRGTLFHTAMRELNVSDIRQAPSLATEIVHQLDVLQARGIFTPQERAALSIGDFTAFFTSSMGARLLAAEKVHREWPFTWRMKDENGETLVQGVIDCCFEERGGWVLLDYKTDGGNVQEILARYREQITLYARALHEITGLPVREKWLYLTRRGHSYPL